MGQRHPGPLCGSELGTNWIDEGTMCRTRSSPPGPVGLDVGTMSARDKIEAAIVRSLPTLPATVRQQVQAMLSPQSLAIIVGTVVLWGGSHAFGVGEGIDILLLWAGYATIGLSTLDGLRELYRFVILAANAQTSSDLDRAAAHFGTAVTVLGISTVSAILLRKVGGSTSGDLGPPENFIYGKGKWWEAHIQSYACLKASLKGEGLHQHHLIPKSLLLKGPVRTRGLIDYVPSVTLDESEHLSTVHDALNSHLASKGVWQRPLTSSELEAAIRFTKEFYKQRGLAHFAEAIEQFLSEIYPRARN